MDDFFTQKFWSHWLKRKVEREGRERERETERKGREKEKERGW